MHVLGGLGTISMTTMTLQQLKYDLVSCLFNVLQRRTIVNKFREHHKSYALLHNLNKLPKALKVSFKTLNQSQLT